MPAPTDVAGRDAERSDTLRIVVLGAGGIGGYLGAMLSRAGHEVTLVCRGQHLEAIQRNGLKVRASEEEWVADAARAAASMDDTGTPDVVLCCVKHYDLEAAAASLVGHVGPETMVIPVLNGVTAHETIARFIPISAVVPGTVFISAHIVMPGLIELTSEATMLSFGELDGSISPRVARFHEAGQRAGYQSSASKDIVAELWSKFAVLNAVNPLCGLSRQPLGVIREDPALRALMIESMREVISLADAKGVRLPPDLVERGLYLTDHRDYDMKVSMLIDMEAGKPLELEWISGYISRESRRLGLHAPIADMAYACISPLAAQSRRRP